MLYTQEPLTLEPMNSPHLAMTDTDKVEQLPKQNDIMREMAQDMNVALYRRYGRAAAAKVLGMSGEELDGLREGGQIGYLDLSDDQISFFGCQLLEFLLECIVPRGTEERPQSAPVSSKPSNDIKSDMFSVDEAIIKLGIGKTKFYELLKTKQIKPVKIGRRTLIKRTELQDFIDKQIG